MCSLFQILISNFCKTIIYATFFCHLPDHENYLTNEVKYFFINIYKEVCTNACALMAKLNQGLCIQRSSNATSSDKTFAVI